MAFETMDTVQRAVERTHATVDPVADIATDAANRESTQPNDALAQALRYASAHPAGALGAVLIAGFLVGRLSRR